MLNHPCLQVSAVLSLRATFSHLPALKTDSPHPCLLSIHLGVRFPLLSFLLQISLSPLKLFPNSILKELNEALSLNCPQQTPILCSLAVKAEGRESSLF